MMEKNIWTLTFIIVFLSIYVEAASRTDISPVWGYICAIDFAIVFTLFINLINNVKLDKDEYRGQVSEDDKH